MFGLTMIVLACGAALAALTALTYRRLRQRRIARLTTITTPGGIDEGRFVPIGGVQQWIHVRGSDRANPVLLVVPGSGLTLEPFSPLLLSWEQHFTVASWDRRDVGRTLGRNGLAGNQTWGYDQLAEEGIEVVEYLRDHLDQDKVILLGHSQGTIVATLMAGRRPDLFHAYVGTGQVVDMPRNEPRTHRLALDRAAANGNRKAARALARLAPPYHDAKTWITKQRWSMATDPGLRAWSSSAPGMVLSWPGYTLADVYRSARAVLFMPPRIFTETITCTPQRLGTTFDVPYFVLHGQTDQHTLPDIAHEYVTAIQAPVKEFVPIPGGGHMTMLQQPEAFLHELRVRVCPLTTTP